MVPGERAARLQQLALVTEILIVYARLRWRLPRADVRALVESIRDRPAVRIAAAEPGSLEARLICGRLGNAVNRTLRPLPTDSRCLIQSLVLIWLLTARAIPSTLVIGAHPHPEFAAHAWVEHRGHAVLPPHDFREARLLEI